MKGVSIYDINISYHLKADIETLFVSFKKKNNTPLWIKLYLVIHGPL